jgi:poly-gamma-glutamate synthesis protein (capsule biosynthesis protein)
MIFLGDVVYPKTVHPLLVGGEEIFKQTAVANLEGAILPSVPGGLQLRKNKINLYCTENLVEFLRSLNVRVVSLANNHITDVSSSPETTIKLLNEAGIGACGAGNNLQKAAEPVSLHEYGQEYMFLAFGWVPIQCIAATPSKPGVNPLFPKHLLESVEKARRNHPEARIILLVHWNYELEIYPQPAHRQLAFAAINKGADAVIGHHSHCVQGIEFYRGRPVVYGLGNWFLPQTEYFGRKLVYPELVNEQLALEWDGCQKGDIRLHWFDYDSKSIWSHIASQNALKNQRGFEH